MIYVTNDVPSLVFGDEDLLVLVDEDHEAQAV